MIEVFEPTEWLPTAMTLPLFTPAECVELLALAYAKDFRPARRLDAKGKPYVDMAFRSSEEMAMAAGDEVYARVTERIIANLDQINARYQFELHPEPERMIPKMTINRYRAERDGRIGGHTDLGHFTGTDDRKLSLSLLLDDSSTYEGGNLVLLDGDIHRPLDGAPAGTVAIFPSYVLHEVEPVSRGVRHSCVVWLRGPRFR